jgi:hypothetical protein
MKKELITQWSKEFTELSIYGQDRLFSIQGVFVWGLKLSKIANVDRFRPTFICYPLWRTNIKACLEEPLFMFQIYRMNGFQFDIEYKSYQLEMPEAILCINNQVPIINKKELKLKDVYNFFNQRFSDVLVNSSPVGQAKIYEGKLFLALYLNNEEEMVKVWNELIDSSKKWDPKFFEWKYGKITDWLSGLQTVIDNRAVFMEQINLNLQDNKITKLKKGIVI